MIKSTLKWLDLTSMKKTWQTATIDKEDFILSVVYNLLKIKGKECVWKYL